LGKLGFHKESEQMPIKQRIAPFLWFNGQAEDIHDEDPAKSQRVMAAMLQVKKIDIAGLKAAYAAA
jgi:predicted 3-demethylubiquinone-9 3-methyltransferase (glyoxalase superfamily)